MPDKPIGLGTDAFEPLSGAPPPDPDPARAVPEPYEDLGPIGAGGMGEIRRVRDPRLRRTLALKALHPHLARIDAQRVRFLEEAQVTAQLQHPGIPPVHEVGTLPDGRPYFTMLEVRGQTLHDAAAGLPLRSRIQVVLRAAEAVAFAHARGVVHRDLKPGNIMLGPFGEVWVMDWGLTRVLPGAEAPPESVRDSGALQTRAGSVQGTPAFMAPEQARGEGVDARTDVYALGAVLFFVLTGRPPHEAPTPSDLVELLREDPAAPEPAGAPEELVAICRRALQPRPEARYGDASALAGELAAFLDDARARDRALSVVDAARAAEARAADLRARAERLREEARALVVAPDAPEEHRWPVWDLEDRATALEAEAEREQVEAELRYEGALTHADVAAARDWLADRHVAAHRAAVLDGDRAAAARHEAYLRAHGPVRYARYLEGTGRLTLHAGVPGARVALFRYEVEHRRLVPRPVADHPAPLAELPLPHGSYLCVVSAPGYAPARYPVLVGRDEHWTGVRPGATEPTPVPLLPEGDPDDLLVPGGPCRVGRRLASDRDRAPVPPQTVWVDGFVVRRFPVSNGEYLAFLNALVDSGEADRAEALVPCYPGGRPVWARDGGRYRLGLDAQGHEWRPDMPVVLVHWEAAAAYAAWRAERDGLPWRLGWELEWEKAARGADGRIFPWGDAFFAGWCRMHDSPGATPGPAPLHLYPEDVSPFGLRHCAGNVVEWTADPGAGYAPIEGGIAVAPPEGPSRTRRMKGGSWTYRRIACRLDHPAEGIAALRTDYQGFRLFRAITG